MSSPSCHSSGKTPEKQLGMCKILGNIVHMSTAKQRKKHSKYNDTQVIME